MRIGDSVINAYILILLMLCNLSNKLCHEVNFMNFKKS
jgi:hypothetical protein